MAKTNPNNIVKSDKNSQKRRFKAFIAETRKFYACFLPKNLKSFSVFLLKLYHHRIKFNAVQQAKIEALDKDAIYIYVTKYRSRFAFLFTYFRFKKLGLAYPRLGLDCSMTLWQPVSVAFKYIVATLMSLLTSFKLRDPYKNGFIKRQLIKGNNAILPLINEKSFKRRFIKQQTDPLQYLIEIERETGRKIYLIPLLPILNKMPNRLQRDFWHPVMAKDKPSNILWRFLPIISGKAFFEVSTPVLLNEYLAADENSTKPLDELANNLRAHLIDIINVHRQGITGPTAKNRQEIKQQILTSESFMEFMKNYAEQKNTSIAAVHKSAEGYLDEIAADFSPNVAKFAYYILHTIFKIMFDGIVVNQDALDAAKEASRKGPVVFIPCHRSHIDYLVLSYMYYKNDLSVPLIAAGKNLSFWPMGPIFRRCGAFFIRRTFHGAVLYANVFSEYISTILQEGYNVEQFIEGGRSRTGKLLTPKLGMLTILLNTLKEKRCKDMTIIPIFIGYDRVVEEKSYLREIKGGEKNPEKFGTLLKASSFLTKHHGTIYIQMAEAISIKALAVESDLDINALQGREYNDFVTFVGNKVISEINRVTITTPFAITASVILNYRQPTIPYTEIQSLVQTYLRYLKLTGTPVAESLLNAPEQGVLETIGAYTKRKFMAPIVEDKKNPPPLAETVYDVKHNRRPDLDYYRNNCITAFIPLAFTSLSVMALGRKSFMPSELDETYFFLKDLFRLEFVRDVDANSKERLQQALRFLVEEELLTACADGGYNLAEEAFPKLRGFASFILPVLETYFVALSFFSTNEKAGAKAKDAVRKISALGDKMLTGHRIETREMLSRITIQNAVEVFTEDKLNSTEHAAEIEPVLAKITRLVQTLH